MTRVMTASDRAASASGSIPYERQLDADEQRRMCGAAALCMVYRSLAIEASQSTIWPRIARPDERGSLCAKTRLICQDALQRGQSAMIVRARQPWEMLQRCLENDVRAIVNHRLSIGSTAGHYSVVIAIDTDEIILHDPQLGPNRRIPRAEFESMWRPHHSRSEIVGDVLVAISNQPHRQAGCSACGKQVPTTVCCPSCRQNVALSLTRLIGCMDVQCGGRTWKRLYCPNCDSGL